MEIKTELKRSEYWSILAASVSNSFNGKGENISVISSQVPLLQLLPSGLLHV